MKRKSFPLSVFCHRVLHNCNSVGLKLDIPEAYKNSCKLSKLAALKQKIREVPDKAQRKICGSHKDSPTGFILLVVLGRLVNLVDVQI